MTRRKPKPSHRERMLLVILTTLAAGASGMVGAISSFGYRFANADYYGAYALVSILSMSALAVFTLTSWVRQSSIATNAFFCLFVAFLISFLSFAATLPYLV